MATAEVQAKSAETVLRAAKCRVFVVSQWRSSDDSLVCVDSVWPDEESARMRAIEIGAFASADELYGGRVDVLLCNSLVVAPRPTRKVCEVMDEPQIFYVGPCVASGAYVGQLLRHPPVETINYI